MLVDRRSVEVVLDGLDDLPGRHLAEEGAGVRDGVAAVGALVLLRVLLAARLPLVVVLNLEYNVQYMFLDYLGSLI